MPQLCLKMSLYSLPNFQLLMRTSFSLSLQWDIGLFPSGNSFSLTSPCFPITQPPPVLPLVPGSDLCMYLEEFTELLPFLKLLMTSSHRIFSPICLAFDCPEKLGVGRIKVIFLNFLVESSFILYFSVRLGLSHSSCSPCLLFLKTRTKRPLTPMETQPPSSADIMTAFLTLLLPSFCSKSKAFEACLVPV